MLQAERTRALAVVALLVVMGFARSADAKKHRIKIVTKPAGATVVVGAGTAESRELGRTPLTTTLPAGQHVILIKRGGYDQIVDTVRVRRNGQNFTFRLLRAERGSVRVVSKKRGALRGGLIFIDGEEVGQVPGTIDVEAGSRQVEVKKEGFEDFDIWIDVPAGEQTLIRAESMSKGSENQDPFRGKTSLSDDDDDIASDDDDDDDDDDIASVGDDGDDDGDDGDTDVALDGSDDDDDNELTGVSAATTQGSTADRGSLLVAELGIDFAGRAFRYSNPETSNLRPFTALANPTARVGATVFPLRLIGDGAISKIGLAGAFGRGAPVNSQPEDDENQLALATTSTDYAIGIRYRHTIGGGTRVTGGVDYAKRNYEFADEDTAVAGEVPDVRYSFIVASAQVELPVSGPFTFKARADFKSVREVGVLESRFNVTGAYGLGAQTGLTYMLSDSLDVVARVHYELITMNFENLNAMEFQAKGGKDHYFGGMVGVGLNL